MREKVIIVTGGDYDSEFAVRLNNLLPEHDIESVVWTEKQYESNRPTTSNMQRIIFFGRKGEARKQAKTIGVWGFDLYGCKLGIVNNVCVITANERELPIKDQKGFVFYCKQRVEAHPDIIVPTIIENPIGFGKVLKQKLVGENLNTIRRAQYSVLIYEFIDNWLDKYINGKHE